MTKKHFEAFAEVIRNIHPVESDGCKSLTKVSLAITQAELVCKVAAQFNPRFNRAIFLAACGL